MTSQKKIALIVALIIIMGIWMVRIYGQTVDNVLQQVELAIQKGSAEDLAVHFNKVTELGVNGKNADYSGNQALFVMKEFFMNHPAQSFSIIHKGSTGTTYYAVGSYKSTHGESFDVNVFLKKYPEGYHIDQLIFEKNKE